jgi:two-component system, LytTR family, sensor kinase
MLLLKSMHHYTHIGSILAPKPVARHGKVYERRTIGYRFKKPSSFFSTNFHRKMMSFLMSFFQSKRWKLYAWLGLAYLVLRILGGLFVYPGRPFEIILNNVWLTIYVTAVNTVFFEFTLNYAKWKRLWTFILLIILHFVFYPWVFYVWRGLGVAVGAYVQLADMSVYDRLSSLMSYAVGSLFFFWLCKHVYDHVTLQRLATQLRLEKKEAELNYLKSQLNPHFLFNTLNNIYSLSRDKSDQAPESILRLSKIMRYMLYETGDVVVSVEKELNIIQNYISLEKLRYDQSLRVSFDKQIEDENQTIPPLILIPLIENAFKHGASETITDPFVDINLSISKNVLVLTVKNSAEGTFDHEIKENIGISNLRRQLGLLFNEFALTLTPSENVFTARLQINLASHV